MTARTLASLFLVLSGAVFGQTGVPSVPEVPKEEYFHGKGHPRDWDPKYAKEDAISALKRGELKMYCGDPSGGQPGPVGVPYQLRDLLKECRLVDSGFTDTVDGEEDVARRDRQFQYATIFNQEILRFLLATSGRRPSELEEAFADKEAEARAHRLLVEKCNEKHEALRMKKTNAVGSANSSPAKP